MIPNISNIFEKCLGNLPLPHLSKRGACRVGMMATADCRDNKPDLRANIMGAALGQVQHDCSGKRDGGDLCLFGSLTCPQYLEYYLAYTRCSTNTHQRINDKHLK